MFFETFEDLCGLKRGAGLKKSQLFSFACNGSVTGVNTPLTILGEIGVNMTFGEHSAHPTVVNQGISFKQSHKKVKIRKDNQNLKDANDYPLFFKEILFRHKSIIIFYLWVVSKLRGGG